MQYEVPYRLHTEYGLTAHESYGQTNFDIGAVSCHILAAGGNLQMSEQQMRQIWCRYMSKDEKVMYYNSNIIALYQMRKELDEILQMNVSYARRIEEQIMQPIEKPEDMLSQASMQTHQESVSMRQANMKNGVYSPH